MIDLPLLELLTSAPRGAPVSAAQQRALQVLSDEWIDLDRRVGLLLAERLQQDVPEHRALALELDPGLATCDVRVLALKAPELGALVAQVAAREDVFFAVRLLSWLLSAEEGRPLHALVARYLSSFFTALERGDLHATARDASRFALSNGWELDLFVRQHEFGRVDVMTSPDGFALFLVDYAHGPLARVRDYQPPPELLRDVFHLGLHARRRSA